MVPKHCASRRHGPFELEIRNLKGSLVLKETMTGINSQSINTASWSRGLYMARILGNGWEYSKKILLK